MPTYTVFEPTGQLTNQQKKTIAENVTRVHSEVTGAPMFFAQFVFADIADGNWFMGGVALKSGQIYIHGPGA